MRKSKKGTYYYKHIISYFIIILIPIICLGLLLQFRLKSYLEDQISKNTQNEVMNLQKSIDTEIIKIHHTVNQVHITPHIRPFELATHPLEGKKLTAYIRQYQSTNFFVKEILFYFHKDKFIYSSNGSNRVEFFINNVYKYSNWSSDDFYKDINEISSPYYRYGDSISIHEEGEEKYLTYLHPVSDYGVRHYATLLFLIPLNAFNDLIDSSIQFSDTSITLILDSKEEVITTRNIDEDNVSSIIDAVKDYDNVLALKTKVNNKPYYLSYIKSQDTGWRYITLTSIPDAIAPLLSMQSQLIAGIIFILILGAAVITILMKINYGPIKNLTKLAQASGSEYNTSDEVKYIEKTLETLASNNSHLQERLDDTKVASKEYALQQLIAGKINWRANDSLHVLNNIIDIENNKFLACILHISSPFEVWEDNKVLIMTHIEQESSKECSILVKEGSRNRQLVLVVSLAKSEDHMDHPLGLLLENIKKTWNIDATLGVGKQYANLTQIPLSYVEASTAVDYRLIQGNGRVIEFEHIVDNIDTTIKYPSEDIRLYKLAIKKGAEEEVNDILNGIIARTTNMSLFQVRSIYFDIMSIAINTLKQSTDDSDDSFDNYPDIFKLARYESLDDIITVVKDLSEDICNRLKPSKDAESLINNMNEYIKANYKDFDLCKMADSLDMHTSNMRAYYKGQVGETIFETVTRLKMDYSTILLTSTSKSVKHISHEVGYDNVSSFIRRFKQLYGVTPGKYREISG